MGVKAFLHWLGFHDWVVVIHGQKVAGKIAWDVLECKRCGTLKGRMQWR